jgi:hypothetical protein
MKIRGFTRVNRLAGELRWTAGNHISRLVGASVNVQQPRRSLCGGTPVDVRHPRRMPSECAPVRRPHPCCFVRSHCGLKSMDDDTLQLVVRIESPNHDPVVSDPMLVEVKLLLGCSCLCTATRQQRHQLHIQHQRQ